MGSAEGFGGGVVVTEVGRLSGGACSSGVHNDNQVDDVSLSASWGKIHASELCRQASQPASLHNKYIAKGSGLESRNSSSLALDVGDKLLIGITGEIPRSHSMCSKRSGMVPMEEIALASYPAGSNASEKTQMVKHRKSSLIKPGDKRNERTQTARPRKSSLIKRGDKRNGKMHKNRCDSISLKNGLVSFNSVAGGTNFFDIQVDDVSVPASWGKIHVSELCTQASQPPSLHNKDIAKNSGLENRNSPSLVLDVGDMLTGRTGEIPRSNSVCSKRPGMVPMDVSDSKSGLLDAEGLSLAPALYPTGSNASEKTQMVKQRKSSLIKPGNKRNERAQTVRPRKSSLIKRGDKRNGKVHKNRCDSISLKNGLVSFNSVAGGNNFFGIYGLKPDAFDITKNFNEIPLDEILNGKYHCPSIAKDKGKKAVNSNSSLLQLVRKAYSVLQARNILQAEKCAEIDHSCNQMVSTSLITSSSSTRQSDGDKGDSCDTDPPSSDKVQESVGKMNISTLISDSPLYQPKEILDRVVLSPPKDLESFLFDVAKPASSFLKQGNDPRMGKSVSFRAGLPPFPWSNSFSGHNKSGADASKLSASRTLCQGKWVNVRNPTALQRGSTDLQMDLESLAFDHSLVPSVDLKSERPEYQFAPTEKLLPSSEACSTSKIPTADEHSPVYAAAQALCEFAIHPSKKDAHSTVMLLEKPSQIAMKACKSRAMERSDKYSDASKSTNGTMNLIKLGDEGFPAKKLKLSTDVRNTHVSHNDSPRKGAFNWSTPEPVRSPPMKLFRESKPEIDRYNINLVKKPYMMKPPRAAERPGGHQKLRKVVPMNWNRPEG